MLYLLDTNVLSLLLRGRDLNLKAKVQAHVLDCRFSAISLMELHYGVDRRPDLPALRQRLQTLQQFFPGVESFDEHAARQAGMVKAYLSLLKPNAQPIGHYDVLLAGHALALGAAIVTHNMDEFQRIPGLLVEDWQS